MKFLVFLQIIFVTINCQNTFAQNVGFQEVEISNSLLQEQISDYIVKEKSNSKEQVLGYLELYCFGNTDGKSMYSLNFSYNTLEQLLSKPNSPISFTEIDGFLVLIYVPSYTNMVDYKLSKRDKFFLNEQIEKNLPQPEKLVEYDSVNKIEIVDNNFRLLPARIDGGICISIYENKTVETIESGYKDCFLNN